MNLPDIYFEAIWGELYVIKDNGKHQIFSYSSNNGQAYYSFIKRKIDIDVDGETYFDIISPYGFSGPIVLNNKADLKDELLKEFKEAFDNYCYKNRIITDSCRFSPWLKNHVDFIHMYELMPNYTTIGIDLSVANIFIDELRSKKRNMIRKAEKLGVTVHFDFEAKNLDAFLSIYEKVIIRNKISEYYRFSKEFLLDNFQRLKGSILIAYAEYKGRIISIAIFLLSNNYIHYHLAANDLNFSGVPANDVLLFEIANFGKRNGFKYVMLGGGGGNTTLHSYKMGFTKNSEFAFFKGKRICNPNVYEKILSKCNKVDMTFFPSYR
jgi:serine/alanine adding enzyme